MGFKEEEESGYDRYNENGAEDDSLYNDDLNLTERSDSFQSMQLPKRTTTIASKIQSKLEDRIKKKENGN